MAALINIKIDRPISAVTLLNDPCCEAENSRSSDPGQVKLQMEAAAEKFEQEQQQMLQSQRQAFELALGTISDAGEKLYQAQSELFKNHKKQIAKLSVEIAEKILRRKLEEGQYDIANIIENALDHTPQTNDVIIYLNVEDLANCKKLITSDERMTGIIFKADSELGRAECRVETAEGTVELLVKDQLKRVEKALSKATSK